VGIASAIYLNYHGKERHPNLHPVEMIVKLAKLLSAVHAAVSDAAKEYVGRACCFYFQTNQLDRDEKHTAYNHLEPCRDFAELMVIHWPKETVENPADHGLFGFRDMIERTFPELGERWRCSSGVLRLNGDLDDDLALFIPRQLLAKITQPCKGWKRTSTDYTSYQAHKSLEIELCTADARNLMKTLGRTSTLTGHGFPGNHTDLIVSCYRFVITAVDPLMPHAGVKVKAGRVDGTKPPVEFIKQFGKPSTIYIPAGRGVDVVLESGKEYGTPKKLIWMYYERDIGDYEQSLTSDGRYVAKIEHHFTRGLFEELCLHMNSYQAMIDNKMSGNVLSKLPKEKNASLLDSLRHRQYYNGLPNGTIVHQSPHILYYVTIKYWHEIGRLSGEEFTELTRRYENICALIKANGVAEDILIVKTKGQFWTVREGMKQLYSDFLSNLSDPKIIEYKTKNENETPSQPPHRRATIVDDIAVAKKILARKLSSSTSPVSQASSCSAAATPLDTQL